MCRCMQACVCVWYTELTCIQDVWSSGHYGSSPRPCVCVSVCVCVGAWMLVCVWYTELTCIQDVWPSGHYGSVYKADLYT